MKCPGCKRELIEHPDGGRYCTHCMYHEDGVEVPAVTVVRKNADGRETVIKVSGPMKRGGK